MKQSIRHQNRINPNIMIFITYGLLYDIAINLYKPFSNKFLERIGGNAFAISLLSSLPGLFALFAILPGSLWLSRLKNKQKATAICIAVSRTILLLLVFVPFFPKYIQPMVFVGLLSFMNFPESISQSSVQSFLGEVLEPRLRSQAITVRNKFGQVVVLVVTLITGLTIGLLPIPENRRIVVYQVFFALSFVVGLYEVKKFLAFSPLKKAIKVTEQTNIETKISIQSILKDKKFVKYLLATWIFHVTWHAGWPLGSILQIKDMGINEVWLAAFAVTAGVISFLMASLWGRLIQKKGNEFTMVVSIFFLGFYLIPMSMAPNNIMMLLAVAPASFATVGVTTTILNGLLSATPEKGRIVYIGVYNTCINVSLAFSPFLAYLIQEWIGTRPALALVGILRISSAVLIYFVYCKKWFYRTQ